MANARYQLPVLTAGIENEGNTCYVNSILQALLHCASFVEWLATLDGHRCARGKVSNFSAALSDATLFPRTFCTRQPKETTASTARCLPFTSKTSSGPDKLSERRRCWS